MVTIRGSWTLHEAIINRWDEKDLDADFKALWPDDTETRYPVLSEDGPELGAPSNPPGPYCVYGIQAQNNLTHMTGKTSTTELQFQPHLVQFVIHAKETSSATAKSIAQGLAKLVATAFDDMTALDISPDAHVVTIRQPDFGVREGEKEYAWTLQYLITIDCEYDTTPLFS
jgi:hypothetical protein|tara:strand:+ start:2574 stop:3086 length:513 start_codon:yes stop_codon:yes gene_type:complete